jgi:hypothetical protein
MEKRLLVFLFGLMGHIGAATNIVTDGSLASGHPEAAQSATVSSLLRTAEERKAFEADVAAVVSAMIAKMSEENAQIRAMMLADAAGKEKLMKVVITIAVLMVVAAGGYAVYMHYEANKAHERAIADQIDDALDRRIVDIGAAPDLMRAGVRRIVAATRRPGVLAAVGAIARAPAAMRGAVRAAGDRVGGAVRAAGGDVLARIIGRGVAPAPEEALDDLVEVPAPEAPDDLAEAPEARMYGGDVRFHR